MDIQKLRYFMAVAQTLNITKAAEQLFITRQALSKAIHEFEKECGSELFLRCNGKLQLTPLGRNLLEKSIPILDLVHDFENSVSQRSKSKNSKIRIAIGLGTLNALSPRVFTDFRQKFPEIDLAIKEVCDDEVRRNLETQEADIGIISSTPEKLKDYDIRLIQDGKIWFQVSRKNPLSAIGQMTLKDLHNQPIVTLGERFDVHRMLVEKCREVGLFPNFILETIDSNVANDMVYNDIAISFFIPTKGSAVNSTVRVIPLDLGDTPWGAYVIRPKGTEYTPSMRLLIDYLGVPNQPE